MFTTQFGLDLYADYFQRERVRETTADRLADHARGTRPEPKRPQRFFPLRRLHRMSLLARPAW